MKIVFISNYFNHHQKPLSDALYSIPGIDYSFVATERIPDFRRDLGYKEISADYVIDVTKSEDNKKIAKDAALNADVAIFIGGGVEEYELPRLKQKKLTFEYSERRFKKGYVNLLSPNLIRHQMMYYAYGKKAPLYMLCSSAYAANDFYFMHSFIDRCFKWGYFTRVEDINIEELLIGKRQSRCRIMWCSRFIDWKHPEMVVQLAQLLKEDGLEFVIDMYGNGPLLQDMKNAIIDLGLTDYVHVMGNAVNDTIISAMRCHNVFLFTSDRNEGWGAVANEAMSNGCTLIGSNEIGAVPFLVKNGENGLIFKSGNIKSLYDSAKRLIVNRTECELLARNAYHCMHQVWSPQNAAERFIQLVSFLNESRNTPYADGPCSKATPI